jgi:hypothetical protein
MFSITFLGAPGAVWSSGEVGYRLVRSILGEIEIAKSIEGERRLGAPETPRAITGPRPPSVDNGKRRRELTESLNQDLDDEIPLAGRYPRNSRLRSSSFVGQAAASV